MAKISEAAHARQSKGFPSADLKIIASLADGAGIYCSCLSLFGVLSFLGFLGSSFRIPCDHVEDYRREEKRQCHESHDASLVLHRRVRILRTACGEVLLIGSVTE